MKQETRHEANAPDLRSKRASYADLSTDGLLDLVKTQAEQIKKIKASDLSDYIFGKPAPYSPELEQSILGAILLESDALQKVDKILKAEDFYEAKHQLIFKTCEKLLRGSKIDIHLAANHLQKFHPKEFEEIGGYYLVELTNRVASSANIVQHAYVVKEQSIQRKAVETGLKLIKNAYTGDKSIFEVLDETRENLKYQELNPVFIGGKASDIMKLAANAKPIKNIFGNMVKTGDIVLFLAPKKTGKTILGYQFANDAANGTPSLGGVLSNEAGPLKTLYVDMELRPIEFKDRYTNAQSKKEFKFSENLDIKIVNPANFNHDTDKMLRELENLIIDSKCEYLIIDNLTAFMKSISDADSALTAINEIRRLNHVYDLTTTIMCHTPKRLPNAPLLSDDILGSGILLNLCTSVFGIRRSYKDRSIIYLKHLDTRTSELVFDEDNIIQMRAEKVDNYLSFHYEGQGKEADHLIKKGDEQEVEIWDEAIKKYNAGASWAKIKTEMGYQYTAQALQKSCIKYAEKSKAYTYIASQQRFVDWLDDSNEVPESWNQVTTVTEVTS
jgi:archaellum biogenesis ATPase FlaH